MPGAELVEAPPERGNETCYGMTHGGPEDALRFQEMGLHEVGPARVCARTSKTITERTARHDAMNR